MRVVVTRLLFFAHGMAVNPGLILLRPERAGDASLIAHEQRHCLQMRAVGTLRWHWRYLTCSAFRLMAEVDAYRAQLAIRPQDLDRHATGLAGRYWMYLTVAQARALLTSNDANEGPRP